jgi:Putative zinc ribbon domain
MKEYKNCQSCGMPKKMDEGKGGTEKDGTKSDKYCSYCYKDGEFMMASEVDTAGKMQKMCIKMMKKQGMNGILAWLFTRGIPRLERWK